MKSKIFWAGLLILAFCFSAMAQDVQSEKKPADSKFAEVVFASNLHCHSCIEKVERELPYLAKGIKEIVCSLEPNTIKVVYKKDKTTPEELKAAIVKLGYQAEAYQSNAKKPSCQKACTGRCASQHQGCSGHQHAEEHKH